MLLHVIPIQINSSVSHKRACMIGKSVRLRNAGSNTLRLFTTIQSLKFVPADGSSTYCIDICTCILPCAAILSLPGPNQATDWSETSLLNGCMSNRLESSAVDRIAPNQLHVYIRYCIKPLLSYYEMQRSVLTSHMS